MTDDIAIQYGQPEPADSIQMQTVICDYCQTEYRIFHASLFGPDPARAGREASYLKHDLLHGEHQDEKFLVHLPTYDLHDAENFMP